MAIKIGDFIESAIWITGDESPSTRARYEQDVRQAVADFCEEQGHENGPVTFTEKRPGDDLVPQVPDHVQGSRVRLLVGEAQIIGNRVATSEGSFVANLDKKDLVRLRTITRNAHAKYRPESSTSVLTDNECDQYIEQYGPEAAIETLRKHTLQ